MFESIKGRFSIIEILLLATVAFPVVLFVASLFGYTIGESSPLSLLKNAISQGLTVFVVVGGLRGWRSIRLLIVAFIVWTFSREIYHVLVYGRETRYLLLNFGTALVGSCLFVMLFWPSASRRKRSRGKQTEAV